MPGKQLQFDSLVNAIDLQSEPCVFVQLCVSHRLLCCATCFHRWLPGCCAAGAWPGCCRPAPLPPPKTHWHVHPAQPELYLDENYYSILEDPTRPAYPGRRAAPGLGPPVYDAARLGAAAQHPAPPQHLLAAPHGAPRAHRKRRLVPGALRLPHRAGRVLPARCLVPPPPTTA